jgi:hypothetical protein
MSAMGQLADKHFHTDRHLVERANGALLLTLVGGGLLVCAIGAAVVDIGRWIF